MKNKFFSRIVIISLIILSFSSLIGCNSSKDSSENVEVGIILPTKDESRWLQDQTQFESKLKDAGFSNEVLFSQGDLSTEKTNIETLISKKIKVLIICANDATVASSNVELAKKAGVTVIAYDRLITDTDAIDYYVTFDSLAVGKAQGSYLANNVPKNKKNIPLYLYSGSSTDSNCFLYFEGAWNELQPLIANGTFKIANSSAANKLKNKATLTKEEKEKIFAQISTTWNSDSAESLAKQQLEKNDSKQKGDVFILAPNDDTAQGITKAFNKDKKITSYIITGQDAQKASVQNIIDGKQSMTVFKDTRLLAKDSIDMAISILKGEQPKTDITYNNDVKDIATKQSAIKILTKDNIKKELINSGYYEASDFSGL